MGEAIKWIFADGQGVWILIAVVLIGVTCKFGHVMIKKDKIIISRDSKEHERLLMMKQKDYAHNACMAFEKRIPRFEGYQVILGKLIAELAYDEIVEWIMTNHIRDDEDYIAMKQNAIWDIITKESVNPKMQEKAFEKEVFKNVETIVKTLVQIRNNEGRKEQ